LGGGVPPGARRLLGGLRAQERQLPLNLPALAPDPSLGGLHGRGGQLGPLRLGAAQEIVGLSLGLREERLNLAGRGGAADSTSAAAVSVASVTRSWALRSTAASRSAAYCTGGGGRRDRLPWRQKMPWDGTFSLPRTSKRA